MTVGADAGQHFLEPGLFLKKPLDQISLGIALVFGTAGMPHILMRFFTVPTAQAARKSVIIAMFVIGGFYVLTTLLGSGAAIHLTPQGITAVDKGGNMATMMLAQKMGAGIAPVIGDLFLAFPSRRSEEMFDEIYVRQNIGIGMAIPLLQHRPSLSRADSCGAFRQTVPNPSASPQLYPAGGTLTRSLSAGCPSLPADRNPCPGKTHRDPSARANRTRR